VQGPSWNYYQALLVSSICAACVNDVYASLFEPSQQNQTLGHHRISRYQGLLATQQRVANDGLAVNPPILNPAPIISQRGLELAVVMHGNESCEAVFLASVYTSVRSRRDECRQLPREGTVFRRLCAISAHRLRGRRLLSILSTELLSSGLGVHLYTAFVEVKGELSSAKLLTTSTTSYCSVRERQFADWRAGP
jgi:hypothetical protein